MSDSQKEDSKGFFYKFDLTNPLEGVIQEYENERERFWAGKGPDYQIKYDGAERFAQFVLKGTENLANTQKIEEDLAGLQYEAKKENNAFKEFNEKSRNVIKGKTPSKEEIEKIRELALKLSEELPEDPRNENSPLRPVWERFCIKLGFEGIDKIEDGANRIFNLYNLMLSSPLSQATMSYLFRLTRCYIWGFDSECVILCRSVLDTAFRAKISDEICKKRCRKKQNRRKQNDYSLSDRIHAAIKEDRIDEKTKSLVDKIKLLGDKAIHEQPNFTKDALGTIRDTISVLESLFGK